jgi:hypothetical protein
MPPNDAPTPLRVTIIAESRDTIDGLFVYLKNAGVASQAMQTLGDVELVAAETTSVVLFPDELDADAVIAWVSRLRASRPSLLVVVISSTPQRIRAALEPADRSPLPIVFPKPAFGWAILDAIRDHAARDDDGEMRA